jgi:hypothetical protein
MNVKEIIKEVEIFIDEIYNEFEFIVDINDNEYYEIDFEDNSFNISERITSSASFKCCSVFIRNEKDDEIEKKYKDDVMKKVIKNNCILYIVI